MPGEQGHRRLLAGLPLAVMAAVVLLDQVSKWIIVRTLGPDQHTHLFEIVPSVLSFHYVENTGAAFGIFRGQMILLTVMAILVVVGIIIIYRRVPDPGPWMMVSLGLLLGGALGNLIDRMRLGYVVDFVAVSVWPKFNVADSAITIGVVVIAWSILFRKGMWAGEQPDAPEPSNSAETSGGPSEPRGLGSMSHDVRERGGSPLPPAPSPDVRGGGVPRSGRGRGRAAAARSVCGGPIARAEPVVCPALDR